MPRLRTFNAEPYCNDSANGPRAAVYEKTAENPANLARKKFWMYTRVDSAGGACVNSSRQ